MEISSVNRNNPEYVRVQGQRHPRASKCRRKPDFLTATFASRPAYDIQTVVDRLGGVELPELENQAHHLLRIYGKELDYEHSGNACKDLHTLYSTIQEQMSDDVEIDIATVGAEYEEGCQEFIAVSPCEGFRTCDLYFIPIRILESIEAPLREILVDFFAFIVRKGPFSLPSASYDMGYQLGILDSDGEEIDVEESQYWSDKHRELAERYVKGDISKIFGEIESQFRKHYNGAELRLVESVRFKMQKYSNAEKTFYETACGKRYTVASLFKAIEDGIKIHLEDSLFNYELRGIRYNLGDDNFYDYVDNDDIVDFDRQFILTWGMDDDDAIVEDLVDSFNSDAGNFSETAMLDICRVRLCDEKITPSDYPKRWYEWYINFLNHIYE